jgi:hypothetical protein
MNTVLPLALQNAIGSAGATPSVVSAVLSPGTSPVPEHAKPPPNMVKTRKPRVTPLNFMDKPLPLRGWNNTSKTPAHASD